MHLTRSKLVPELFGLSTAPRTGRQRLVAAGIEVFYRHGFGSDSSHSWTRLDDATRHQAQADPGVRLTVGAARRS